MNTAHERYANTRLATGCEAAETSTWFEMNRSSEAITWYGASGATSGMGACGTTAGGGGG